MYVQIVALSAAEIHQLDKKKDNLISVSKEK
jgi:hypothetical protein